MYWTLELASKLEDAPWPATKDELIDYAIRSGAPLEVLENLQEIEDEGEVYESIEDIWPDYPTKEDFLFNEEKSMLENLIAEDETAGQLSGHVQRLDDVIEIKAGRKPKTKIDASNTDNDLEVI